MEKKHQENSRSPRKRIINFLVHVLLAVLALIWVMPIVWIVLRPYQFPGRAGCIHQHVPAEKLHYPKLREAPDGQECSELPENVQKYADHCCLQLLYQHIFCVVRVVFPQPNAVQNA